MSLADHPASESSGNLPNLLPPGAEAALHAALVESR